MAQSDWLLKWHESGEKTYETGVKRGVLYPEVEGAYPQGYAWNGITSVDQSPSGADENKIYADDEVYLSLRSIEEFGGSIGCYAYPDAFKACNGEKELVTGVTIGQQTRQAFGLSYVTTMGNDEKKDDYGYKIHLVYGATCSPSSMTYESISNDPAPIEMSYEFTTVPVPVTGSKPISHLVIDSTKVNAAKLTAFEDILYGKGSTQARLPLPAEVVTLLSTT